MFSFSVSGGAARINNACAPADAAIQKMRPASKNSGGPRHAHFVLGCERQHEIEVRVPIYFVAALLMFTNNKKRIIFTSWTRIHLYEIIGYTSRTNYREMREKGE
jgi:hypothetical protein